jgi:hypothetical protein
MCSIAALVLNVFHPGYCFENTKASAKGNKEVMTSGGESEVEFGVLKR